MLRKITVTVLYECDDDAKLTNAAKVEEMVYEEVIDGFACDEGFQGLRVDCEDCYNDKLKQYDWKRYIF